MSRETTKYVWLKLGIRITGALCIIATILLILLKGFLLEEITVEGLSYYTKEEFLNKISTEVSRKNTLLFRLKCARDGELTIPYIERYEVEANGKHGISIQVYEKILVGCVKVMGQYLYFDKDGLVTETAVERIPGIPVIRGLEFDRIVLYENLKIQKDELYSVILNITKLVKEYNIPAESVSFNSRGEVELTVGTVTAELGKRNVYDLPIQKLADILPSIADRKVIVDLSDYNGEQGDIIAKPKEE